MTKNCGCDSKAFGFCPFSLFLFGTTSVAYTRYLAGKAKKSKQSEKPQVRRPSLVWLFALVGRDGTLERPRGGTPCTVVSNFHANLNSFLRSAGSLRGA